jgi:predicted DNA-binding ribbon-helix-helix protein
MPAVIDTHETVSQLLTSIDAGRQHANLSSAMRLFVLGHYQPRSRSRRNADKWK